MGEVYRARDTKLGREVAIKVLPEPFATDPERVARFRREAQVLAALNHPHIAAIYGLEDAGGMVALAMELVEGDDLAQRLAKGPIPLDETLGISTQLAQALDAAHEQGIVHRDLKPANIKVRPDGTAKVLDFGLAKLMESAVASLPSGNASVSPTFTSPVGMTAVGMIVGTATYMSPEQARGRPADRRSDVWAFGCVLYEMLAGRRPFDGADVSEVLAFVITTEPDWGALPVSTPSSLRRLLADRWSNADIVVQSSMSGGRRVVMRGGSSPRYVRSGHLLYSVEGTLMAVPFDPARQQVMGPAVAVIEGVRRSLTTNAAQFSVADNGSLVYVPGTAGPATAGRNHLVMASRKGEITRLPLPRLTTADRETAHVPQSWSPSGDMLLFTSNTGGVLNAWTGARNQGSTSTLFILSLKNRQVEPFAGIRSHDRAVNAEFSPDGAWIAYSTGIRPTTVYLRPFPLTGAVYQVSKNDDGHHPW